MAQLHAENRCLECVQTAVRPKGFVAVLFTAAIDEKLAQTAGKVPILGCDHATVARAPQILGSEKTETAQDPEAADSFALVVSADGLSGIFDDGQAMRACSFQNGVDSSRQPEELNGIHGPRSPRDGRFALCGINVEGRRIDIPQNRT